MTILLMALLTTQSPAVEELQRKVSEENLKTSVATLVAFETRMSLSSADDDKRGVGAARRWVKAEFERHAKGLDGVTVAYHDWEDASPRLSDNGKRVPQKNVYAVLKGTKRPKEAVVIGAHYDSLNLRGAGWEAPAPGANDNASGTAAVLECFRILAAKPAERTIIFAAFASEEQGLIGARHFAEWLKERGEFDVVAMLNNDIVGGAKDDAGKPLNEGEIRVFSAPPADSDSRRFARLAKFAVERSAAGLKVLLQETADRPRRGGDHLSFNQAGYTAIRFIEAVETDQYHHTLGDTADRIHVPYHAKAVKADIALLCCLANAPATPAALTLEGRQVAWKAVDGAERYLVGVRGAGNDFLRTLETTRTAIDVEPGHSYCVAAMSASGGISLFSPEIAAK